MFLDHLTPITQHPVLIRGISIFPAFCCMPHRIADKRSHPKHSPIGVYAQFSRFPLHTIWPRVH